MSRVSASVPGRRYVAVAIAGLLGCALSSPVLHTGTNTYLIRRTGNDSADVLMAEALDQAAAYCRDRGLRMEPSYRGVRDVNLLHRTRLGIPSAVELQFYCVPAPGSTGR